MADETPATVGWRQRTNTFLATARAVAATVSHAEPDAPGLGEWNQRNLAAHTLRALTTLVDYLSGPEPAPPPLEGAAAYLTGYLDARDQAPAEMDAAVAMRAKDGSAGMTAEQLIAGYEAATAAVAASLVANIPGRLVATRFGSMRLDDYLRTRQFELVVHGYDLATAIPVDFEPPQVALADALQLLADVAVHRNVAPQLLRALTGRAPGHDVLPILR